MKQKSPFVAAAAIVALSLLPALAACGGNHDRIIPLQRIEEGVSAKTGQSPSPRPFPCVLGGGPLRSPLEGAGRTYADLLSGARAKSAEPDTFRVAVFRIDWEEDSAEELTTAPGGRMLVDPDSIWAYAVDYPPHDSTYFHTQLEVLRTFYWHQSYGRVYVEWEIFPKSATDAYHLHDTADYLPEGDPASWDLIERSDLLVKFCTDAIRLVDTVDATVDFSAYDGYMLFHAGPDLQTDINGDSPGDIPSFFLSLGDSDVVYVDADDDSLVVNSVTCVPEYDSQDGFNFGLNGVLAHEFGHQLGLPDLYNTDNFWPAVGQWDLMDSGGLVSIGSGDGFLTGIIPTSLSVWSKVFLGWIDPLIVTEPGAFTLACATHPDPPAGSARYALIPLNDMEYFLVENRFGLSPIDQFAARADSLNGVVLGPVTNDEARTPTYDYDFPLPGWGTLIWHVNERNINPFRVAINDVNVDYLDRGLELEEADGIKDLGNPYSAYWDGSPYDPFYRGSADRFGPSTMPNSDLTDGARSFVDISGITAPDSLMNVQIDLRGAVPDFPLAMTADSTIIAPAGVIETAGALHAFWVSLDSLGGLIGGVTSLSTGSAGSLAVARSLLPAPPAIFAVAGEMLPSREGAEVVTICDDGSVVLAGGDRYGAPAVVGSIGNDTVRTGALVLDGDGDDIEELYVAAGESLAAWSFRTEDSIGVDGRLPLPGRLVSNLAGRGAPNGEPEIRFVTADGSFHRLRPSALSPVFETVASFPPTEDAWVLSGDVDRSGGDDWVVVDGAAGIVRVLDGEGALLPGWPAEIGREVTGEPFFTERNGDGYPEIALPAGEVLYILERNGVSASDTPYEIPELLAAEEGLVANGLSLRMSDDGRYAPVAADGVGRLWTWRRRDEVPEGWPVSTGTWNSLLVAAPLPGGGQRGLYALSRDGFLYAFAPGIGVDQEAVLWGGPGGGPSGRFRMDDSVLAGAASGSTGEARIAGAFAYPNPARGAGTRIWFSLDRSADVSMEAYDMAGQRVTDRNVRGTLGANEIRWDTGELPSGVYYVRLETDGAVEFVKVAVVR